MSLSARVAAHEISKYGEHNILFKKANNTRFSFHHGFALWQNVSPVNVFFKLEDFFFKGSNIYHKFKFVNQRGIETVESGKT